MCLKTHTANAKEQEARKEKKEKEKEKGLDGPYFTFAQRSRLQNNARFKNFIGERKVRTNTTELSIDKTCLARISA